MFVVVDARVFYNCTIIEFLTDGFYGFMALLLLLKFSLFFIFMVFSVAAVYHLALGSIEG